MSTKALGDTTPYEVWSGRKPNLEHLRVFGCTAHAKVLRGHLHKIDSRSEALVYLGTETGSKAYRLLDPNSGKIRVSRDVYFEEDKPWSWEKATTIKATPGVTLCFGINMPQHEPDNINTMSDTIPVTFEVGNDDVISSQENSQLQATQSIDHHASPTPATPISSVGSTSPASSISPASSSTGGGAPKRYRTLVELYKECEELLFMQDAEEPTSYSMAAKKGEWVKAMKTELDAIERNRTWRLVDLPPGRKPIGLK